MDAHRLVRPTKPEVSQTQLRPRLKRARRTLIVLSCLGLLLAAGGSSAVEVTTQSSADQISQSRSSCWGQDGGFIHEADLSQPMLHTANLVERWVSVESIESIDSLSFADGFRYIVSTNNSDEKIHMLASGVEMENSAWLLSGKGAVQVGIFSINPTLWSDPAPDFDVYGAVFAIGTTAADEALFLSSCAHELLYQPLVDSLGHDRAQAALKNAADLTGEELATSFGDLARAQPDVSDEPIAVESHMSRRSAPQP